MISITSKYLTFLPKFKVAYKLISRNGTSFLPAGKIVEEFQNCEYIFKTENVKLCCKHTFLACF